MRVTRSKSSSVSVAARPRVAKARAKKPRAPVDGFRQAAKPRAFELPAMLDAAGRVRRGRGPEGSEALITGAERERVTALFGQLPAAKLAAVQRLLLSVPEGAAQALLLKAVAARATRLGGDERALDVLARFAKLISAVPETELLERATVLDLDSTVSSSNVDLTPMWSKRGTIRGAAGHGEDGGNDGLLQLFTAACGPTIIQMMRAQVDPVLAFAINSAGRQRDTMHGEVARFQRALLEEYGGIAIGRRESYVLARLHNAMGRLGLEGDPLSDANIAAVRERYDGFPGEEDVRRVRAAVIPARDEGIGFDEFATMLERYVSRLTGAKYTQTTPAEGFARGQAWRHLDGVERAVKAGYDVPFGVMEPAHWMLITDVRGESPARELLVSDPDSGRTAWVKEKSLVDGSFAKAQFDLPKPKERPYIDSFYLPAVTDLRSP